VSKSDRRTSVPVQASQTHVLRPYNNVKIT